MFNSSKVLLRFTTQLLMIAWIILSSFHTPAWANPSHGSSSVSAEEREALQSFVSLANEKGALLTPPLGSIQPQSQAARAYVKAMIEKLAGPELKARGVNLVVNLYANDMMNAWVQEMSETAGEEAKWKAKHPSATWPIRRWLGFDKNPGSIFEIGVTTGLLRSLKHEAELAFVLGHELTHLLEGHTHHGDDINGRLKSWWSSQSNETVADNRGIEMLLGQYDLDGALIALRRTHAGAQQIENGDWLVALESGAATHHHEGVRISMAQFYVEYLRRSDAKAVLRSLTPIPEKLKFSVAGRDPRAIPVPAAEKAKFLDVVDRYFLEGKVYEYLINSEERFYHKYPHEISSVWEEGRASDPNAVRELLLAAWQQIDKSDRPKWRQANSLLLTMALLSRDAGNGFREAFDSMTPHELSRLKRWLADRSVGQDAWSVERLQPELGRLLISDATVLDSSFLSSKNGQKVLSDLMKTIPAWRSYWSYLTSTEVYVEDGVLNTKALYDKLSNGTNATNGVLRRPFLEAVLASISKIPLSRLSESYWTPGYRAFGLLSSQMKKTAKTLNKEGTDPGYGPLVERLDRDFIPLQMSESAAVISDSKRPFIERLAALNSIAEIVGDDALPEHTKPLKDALLIFARDLGVNSEKYEAKTMRESGILLHLTADLLADPSVSSQDKWILFKVLSSVHRSSFSWGLDDYSNSNVLKKQIADYLLSLGGESLMRHLVGHLPSLERTLTDIESLLPPQGLPRREAQKLLAQSLDAPGAMGKINMSSMVKIRYPAEIASAISLALETGGPRALDSLSFEQAREILRQLENAVVRGTIAALSKPENRTIMLTREASNQIMRILVLKRTEAANFNAWYDVYSRALRLVGSGYMLPEGTLEPARRFAEESLKKWPPSDRYRWFRHANLRKLVSPQFLAAELNQYLSIAAPAHAGRATLSSHLDRINKELDLKVHVEAFDLFRNKVAQDYNLQPDEAAVLFPQDNRTVTEKANGFTLHVRGLSAIVGLTRSQPISVQLEMIEYLMGRRDRPPTVVDKADLDMSRYSANGASLSRVLQIMRSELFFRGPLERSFVVNSLLAGPNGPVESESHLDAILDRLLSAVSPQNRDLARQLANGLFEAEGAGKSFIIAYVLSQQPSQMNGELSEAMVLKSLLDAYGVPGVKLGQYLAFSNEFKDYQVHLEAYQDAALPLNYFEALQLIRKRLGDKWDPAKYRVVGVLGSGSVNIAVEYEDLETGKHDVVSLSRDEIETKTQEDFRRFRALIRALTRDGQQAKKFEFLVGLMDIIRRSVELEFDKPHAFDMQKMAEKLYVRESRGWKVRTVEARQVIDMGLFMEKAPGRGARKVLREQPDVYKDAMKALLEVEYDVLRGVADGKVIRPAPLFANPDLHDGQVLIDAENKTVTILDFGQAIEISNLEREFAVDLLRIISGTESAEKAAQLIEKYAKALRPAGSDGPELRIDRKELSEIIGRKERMDVFVHLASSLERSGFQLPLSSIHWVLAANRLIVLGKKVGVPTEKMFRNLVIARKAGLEIETYNLARRTWTQVGDAWAALTGFFGKNGKPSSGAPASDFKSTAKGASSAEMCRLVFTPR